MIVYRIITVTANGTVANHAVREADLENIGIVGLAQALNELYDFDHEIGFEDFIQVTIKRNDEEPEPIDENLMKAFHDLRPFLNFNDLGDEAKIFRILEDLKASR